MNYIRADYFAHNRSYWACIKIYLYNENFDPNNKQVYDGQAFSKGCQYLKKAVNHVIKILNQFKKVYY